MKNYKKLAFAAVSMVMAGTMAISFAACGDGGTKHVDPTDEPDYYGVLNSDGSINYDAYKRDSEVTLNLAVGHNSMTTSTAYHDLGAEITMPDGNTYNDGDMKPAWAQMGKDLNITWNDIYKGEQTSKNLSSLITTQMTGGSGTMYDNTDLFTADLSKIIEEATNGTSILDLGKYLNRMPNFSAFLKNNPVVYLSLLQYGMDTKTGDGKVIYVAPYFDGNDDIERYCLIRHDWAETILNGSASTGSTAKASESLINGAQGSTYQGTKVESYFGDDSYEIDSLTADGKGHQTIKKDYAAAKAAAKDENSDLGKAYKAITGSAYTGDEGNIVDIMNHAIAANADATGAQLADLYRAYIDAAYKVGNNAAYSADKRANLFTGYDAAWDVDDLVALLRCIKTNGSALGAGDKTIEGIAPRTGQNDRTPDIVRLAAQLYGARGGDSRLDTTTYIDANGDLQDARNDAQFYQALVNLNLLKQEGLVANYPASDSFKGERAVGSNVEFFMMYDYSQTQTLNGFYHEDTTIDSGSTPVSANDNFHFAPILTPVAKWDTNSNGKYGEKGEIIRFTESWRSTKSGGLALNGALENPGNEAKLDAALQFVDYLYSEDGQIVSTFGPMAENKEGKNGFWYNEVAKDGESYFTYKGVKYSGTDYKGRTTPTVTDNLLKSFKDKEVNGWKVTSNSKVSNSKLNFTNYARQLIGSTLPVGVKDQSFENQLTSKMGADGANVVGVALDEEVVKGMTLTISKNTYWYTVVPTSLPIYPFDQRDVIDGNDYLNFKYMCGEQKDNKNFFSLYNYIIQNGLGGSYNAQDIPAFAVPNNVADLVTAVSNAGGQKFEDVYADAWDLAKDYWNYLKP